MFVDIVMHTSNQSTSLESIICLLRVTKRCKKGCTEVSDLETLDVFYAND